LRLPDQQKWHNNGKTGLVCDDTPAGADRCLPRRLALGDQERESSDSPMLKAFWRVAPSVRFSFLAICDAEVFFFASDFRSRTSAEVHARRFFALFAIKPPFHERQFVSLAGVNEKPTDQFRVNRDPSVTIQMSSVTE
jgi:hypothetical protein